MNEIRHLALSCALAAAACAAEPLPIVGIAHVGYKTSNIEAARRFYTGILGYEQAFALRDSSGKTTAAFFKVNDDQFVKLTPVPAPAPDDRLTAIALETSDIEKMRRMLSERGMKPSAIEKRADGSRYVSLTDPDGHLIEFVQHLPDSRQRQAKGKHLTGRRVSDRLWHTGFSVRDEAKAMAFYRDGLGFEEIWRGGPEGAPVAYVNMRMPGRGDYVEYMLHHGQLTRSRLGSMHHICLRVDDIQAGRKKALANGLPDNETHQPRVGRIRRWLMNMFDPDGTRTELMEPHTVP